MPIFGVSINKQVLFRGVQQPFANVYHYNGPSMTEAQAILLASAIKALEVPFHGSDVTFVGAKVWTAGGAPSANQMLAQPAQSGTGSQANNSTQDRERAVLVRFTLGFDSRGRPTYLRKWYHSCGSFAGVSFIGTGIQGNTGQIPSVDRTTIAAAADDLLSVTTSAGTYQLCSPSGELGSLPVVAHPYLEHHQLGDLWRG